MRAYMDSLDKLRGRAETIYWPGHGGPVVEPQRYLRALIHHRRQREASILNALADGPQTIPALVAKIYVGLNPSLTRAAGLSTLAHLEDLSERGTGGRRSAGRRRAALPSRLNAGPLEGARLFRGYSRAARSVTVAGRHLFAHFLEGLVVVAELNRRHAGGIAGVGNPGASALQDQHGFRRQDLDLLLLDERSGAVDRDQVRLAETFAGDDHRIVVLEHGHVRDHRVSDNERRRALQAAGRSWPGRE